MGENLVKLQKYLLWNYNDYNIAWPWIPLSMLLLWYQMGVFSTVWSSVGEKNTIPRNSGIMNMSPRWNVASDQTIRDQNIMVIVCHHQLSRIKVLYNLNVVLLHKINQFNTPNISCNWNPRVWAEEESSLSLQLYIVYLHHIFYFQIRSIQGERRVYVKEDKNIIDR